MLERVEVSSELLGLKPSPTGERLEGDGGARGDDSNRALLDGLLSLVDICSVSWRHRICMKQNDCCNAGAQRRVR